MIGFGNVEAFTGGGASDTISELRKKMGIVSCFPIFSACDESHSDGSFYLALCHKNAAPIEERAAN